MIFDGEPVIDPATGKMKRKQKWVTFKGNEKQADAKLRELCGDVDKGQYIEPSTLTVLAYLQDWVERVIKNKRAPNTYLNYAGIIKNYIAPSPIASLPLQRLQDSHLEDYYANLPLAESSKLMHHVVLRSALQAAAKKHKVARNVADLVDGKPVAKRRNYEDVLAQCWTSVEAAAFLAVVEREDPQTAAFFWLALETGMRRAELCGLKWGHDGLDLERGHARVLRQLAKGGSKPAVRDTKNHKPRTIRLSAKCIQLLRAHKLHQAEFKMAHRLDYHDHGFAFAKEHDKNPRWKVLGDPLKFSTLGPLLDKLSKKAGVKRIKFHGLRHTCATLALDAGVPVKVVSERLGHANTAITQDIYMHVLPSMQDDAAAVISALLQGKRAQRDEESGGR